jgi:hypothetical protein
MYFSTLVLLGPLTLHNKRYQDLFIFTSFAFTNFSIFGEEKLTVED